MSVLLIFLIVLLRDPNYASFTTWENGPTFSVSFDDEKGALKFEANVANNNALALYFDQKYSYLKSAKLEADGILFEVKDDKPRVKDIDILGQADDSRSPPTPNNLVDPKWEPFKSGTGYKFTVWRYVNTGDPSDIILKCGNDVLDNKGTIWIDFIGTWWGRTAKVINVKQKDTEYDLFEKHGEWKIDLNKNCHVTKIEIDTITKEVYKGPKTCDGFNCKADDYKKYCMDKC